MGPSPLNLLLVEDDYVTAFSMRQRLEGAGFRVVGVAPDSAAALRLAEHEAVQLALIAIRRGAADHGVGIARALRAHHGVPTLFVTAHARLVKAAQDVALGYLQKPVSGIALLEAISAVAARIAGDYSQPLPAGLHLFEPQGD